MTSSHNLESCTPGPINDLPSPTRGGRRMRESCTYGVVRGALSDERPYRDHHCLRRGTSAPDSNFLRRLLRLGQNASVVAQGCAEFSSDSTDRNHLFKHDPRWASSSLR